MEAADAFSRVNGGRGADLWTVGACPFLTASSADTARLLAIARPAYEAALAARGLVLALRDAVAGLGYLVADEAGRGRGAARPEDSDL